MRLDESDLLAMKKKKQEGLVRAGELFADHPLLKLPSSVEMRLIGAAEEIRTAPPEDIAFQHTVLCQTGLPYRGTDARTWDARNGRVFLHIKAGEYLDAHTEQWLDVPLP